eukprot:s799_g18.t1
MHRVVASTTTFLFPASRSAETKQEAMGCAAGMAKKQYLEGEATEEMDLSYETWRWKHVARGQAGPPNRKLHEKHLKKLSLFLQQVDDKPWAFSEYLEKRRGVNDKDIEIRVSL